MQGIVTDENGAYVKAAIVKLFKAKDSDDESGAEAVTYAETDEDGTFIIQDLNPDEKYIIEIHVEYPETDIKADAAEVMEKKPTAEPEEEPEEEPAAEPEGEPEEQLHFDDDGPDPYLDDEEENFAEEYDETEEFVRSFAAEAPEISQIDYSVTENISVNNFYTVADYLKDKPYLLKNNLW